jgi:hypothetical protein
MSNIPPEQLKSFDIGLDRLGRGIYVAQNAELRRAVDLYTAGLACEVGEVALIEDEEPQFTTNEGAQELLRTCRDAKYTQNIYIGPYATLGKEVLSIYLSGPEYYSFGLWTAAGVSLETTSSLAKARIHPIDPEAWPPKRDYYGGAQNAYPSPVIIDLATILPTAPKDSVSTVPAHLRDGWITAAHFAKDAVPLVAMSASGNSLPESAE